MQLFLKTGWLRVWGLGAIRTFLRAVLPTTFIINAKQVVMQSGYTMVWNRVRGSHHHQNECDCYDRDDRKHIRRRRYMFLVLMVSEVMLVTKAI